MRARSLALALALAAIGGTAAGPAPAAAADRPDATGDTTRDSANFRLHYRPGAVPDRFAEDLLDRLELSYTRLVTGAGGTPNAGMRAPISDAGAPATDVPPADADGLTDVYVRDLGGSLNGRVDTTGSRPTPAS